MSQTLESPPPKTTNAVDNRVSLGLSNGLSPMVMEPCDGGGSYLYMILPVRLKAEDAE